MTYVERVNLAIDHQRREWRRPLADSTRTSGNDGQTEDLLDRIGDEDPRGDPFEATAHHQRNTPPWIALKT